MRIIGTDGQLYTVEYEKNPETGFPIVTGFDAKGEPVEYWWRVAPSKSSPDSKVVVQLMAGRRIANETSWHVADPTPEDVYAAATRIVYDETNREKIKAAADEAKAKVKAMLGDYPPKSL